MLATGPVLSALVIVGLIVLIALGKVQADVGVPIIVALAGVHAGATINQPSAPSQPPGNIHE
jgi:hypothetical protein